MLSNLLRIELLPRMPRAIVVIGGLVTDLVTVARRASGSEGTIVPDSFNQHPGGKGANFAVACYRLSHKEPAPINDACSNTEPIPAQTAVAAPMQSAASSWEAMTAFEGDNAKSLPNRPIAVNGIPHEGNPFAVSPIQNFQPPRLLTVSLSPVTTSVSKYNVLEAILLQSPFPPDGFCSKLRLRVPHAMRFYHGGRQHRSLRSTKMTCVFA